MAASPRPALTPLSEVRAARVERIVVAKLDRLTQSVRDLAELIELCAKHEVALVSIGEALEPRIGSQEPTRISTGSAARFSDISNGFRGCG
jgi:DNA invertase Pin-like site-specific DNA recombinase